MAIMHFRSGNPLARNRLAPWWNLDPITRPFGRLVGESGLLESAARWMPAVNVEETGDDLVLTADLPGFNEEAIEIGLDDGVLTIRGEIDERHDPGDRRYHLRERRLARFQRSFTLPRTVSADAITATFENGVLRIHMPKAPESKGRTIRIGRPA